MWKYYVILSAFFAAMTAILAKFGVRDINSNLATAIRTTVILLLPWGIELFTGRISHIRELTWKAAGFLVASGLATGLSWLFYFKALFPEMVGIKCCRAPLDGAHRWCGGVPYGTIQPQVTLTLT